MQQLVGQTINGYEIRQQIGEGGFGAVYEAFQPHIGRTVALKVILPQFAADTSFARRFETEAQLVAQLEHPHIVPLIDYWRDDTGAYLIMRYLPGSSLVRWLREDQPLELERLRKPLLQIASAVDYAHKQGVVHRDIKPPNILLDTEENAYLSDFGIARVSNSDITAGGAIGTPYYMSPEQIAGNAIDGRSDIYSLGIMVFELITGRKPYMADSDLSVILKHLQDPIPSIRDLRPDVPQLIDSAVQQAMAKRPDERFDTATEFAQLIDNALDPTPSPIRTVLLPPLTSSVETQPKAEKAPSAVVSPKAISTSNRGRTLEKVHQFWIKGVLENAAYSTALLDLQMTHVPDAVHRAWDMVLEQPQRPRRAIQAGTPIVQVFDDLGGELLIMGDPGAGKTTLLLELARDLIARAQEDEQHPIPVVFNLSSWATSRKSLALWLADELNTKYQVPRKLGRDWVDSDQILPLLDGLDEVKPAVRDQCVSAINDFRRDHGLLPIAICSRTADYEALTERLNLAGAIVLQPLTFSQVDDYLQKAGTRWSSVHQLLTEDEMLRQLVTSPLMLSIVMVAYQDARGMILSLSADLPERRGHLFDAYVERMLARRSANLPYTTTQTRHYLKWLARQMSKRTMTIFTIEGLQVTWLTDQKLQYLFVLGGLPIALLIGWLIGMSAGTMIGFCVGVAAGVVNTALPAGFLIGFFVGILIGLFVGALHWYDPSIRGADRLTIRFEPLPTLMGIGAGLFIYGVGYILAGTPGAIAIGIPGMIISLLALNLRLSENVDIRFRPNQGIWRIIRNISRFTLLAGLPVALIGWLLLLLTGGMMVHPLLGLGAILVAGFSISLAFGLASGGIDHFIKHWFLRFFLALEGNVPNNYARFLDFAASRVLLQKVGGGYIFFHRLLLEYFADLDNTTQ